MPKYTPTNISGDAAEYLVAYTVTHKLGWPCRLLGVDIGVDAELEVLDENGASNGDLIKIQVKGFQSMNAEGSHVYTDDAHIKYWKNFSAPLIVCYVDHSKAAVYWQSIYQSELYLSGGMANRITFNQASSTLLDANSKIMLRALVRPPEAKNFSKHMDTIKAFISQWRAVAGISAGPNEGQYLNEVEKSAIEIQRLVQKLIEGSATFPWRFSPIDRNIITEAERAARRVKQLVDDATVAQFY